MFTALQTSFSPNNNIFWRSRKVEKIHFMLAPSLWKYWIRIWKGIKDEKQASEERIVSSQGPSLRNSAQVSHLNHGPQLHHRLGPQLHHVESGIYYKFRTRGCPKTEFALKKAMFTALQTRFSPNYDIFWRSRKVEKSVLFWPHYCDNAGYESEKVRKIKSKPLKSESYHHRAPAYVIQLRYPISITAPSSTTVWAPSSTTWNLEFIISFGLEGAPRLPLRWKKLCLQRCRRVLVQIMIYFDVLEKLKNPFYFGPIIVKILDTNLEKVRKMKSKPLKSESYHHRAPACVIQLRYANLNHGPQLHHRLGPQLHHVESGIH